MDTSSTSKQITAMCSFISQEATEQVRQINSDAENEYSNRKMEKERVLTSELKENFATKKKKALKEKRIDQSRRSNEARLTKMKKRDEFMKKLRDDVLLKLAAVSTSDKYADLIRLLIAQGLLQMNEEKVNVQCRKEDLKVVEAQIKSATELFQNFVKNNTGIVPACTVYLQRDSFLPPGPTKDSKGLTSCGGVILSARNGTIKCCNTLESRLDLAFEKLIPSIRGLLFPQPQQAKKVVATESHSH